MTWKASGGNAVDAQCSFHWSVARSLGPDGTPRGPLPSRTAGLLHATYQRPVNEYNRVLDELNALPNRALWLHLRTDYEHQFLNRIVRIRRRPGLPTPEPPAKRWYRVRDAALFLGVSTTSVLRWTATGFLRCERPDNRAHRYSPTRNCSACSTD